MLFDSFKFLANFQLFDSSVLLIRHRKLSKSPTKCKIGSLIHGFPVSYFRKVNLVKTKCGTLANTPLPTIQGAERL